MKKIILALVVISAAVLLSGCGSGCCGASNSCCSYNTGCCGVQNYSGIWY
ncbi:YgdI/YgdR family lipoprotein [Legionella sp. PATHC032]|nr:hypothetical protein [Legionella sp. PATHC032]MCW8421772.1 YgdI/YgdR family lipoprotein [Legionella sp. PATHC032]